MSDIKSMVKNLVILGVLVFSIMSFIITLNLPVIFKQMEPAIIFSDSNV